MRRLIALTLLFSVILPAANKEEWTWSELSSLKGRTVSMTMPSGATVSGALTAVEDENLVLQVRQSSDKKASPKGRLAVPRAQVKSLELPSKGRGFKALGTIVGAFAGVGLGGYAAAHTNSVAAGIAVFAAVGGGVTALGYYLGAAPEHRTTIITVRP